MNIKVWALVITKITKIGEIFNIFSSSSNESLEVEAEMPFQSSDEEYPAGEESLDQGDESENTEKAVQNGYFFK